METLDEKDISALRSHLITMENVLAIIYRILSLKDDRSNLSPFLAMLHSVSAFKKGLENSQLPTKK